MVRMLLVLLSVAVIGASVFLFAAYGHAPSCTHGISSAGPVTIVGGKVKVEQKPSMQACLL